MFRFVLPSVVLLLVACGGDPRVEQEAPQWQTEVPPSQTEEAAAPSGEQPAQTQTPGPTNNQPVTTEPPGGDSKEEPVVDLGKYGYHFADELLGKPCSTGPRKFDSLGEMCLHIQDPVGNNDCAASARIEKFHKECDQDFYEWNTGFQCEVVLIDYAAPVVGFEPIDPKYILAEHRTCVGFNVDGSPANKVFTRNELVPGLFLVTNMTHRVPMLRGEDAPAREARFQLFSGEQQVAEESFGADTFGGGLRAYTSDRAYRYQIGCHRSWACNAGQ